MLREEWGHHRHNGWTWFDSRAVAGLTGVEFVMPLADKLDWTVEPKQSLSELYRQRAQYLRDHFDYLILMYSGGSDSHQTLMSFIGNGIFLDEVRTCYPMKWVEKVSGFPYIGEKDDPLGLLFEYHYATVPGLREVSLLSPATKISVMDFTDAFAARDMSEWTASVFPGKVAGGLHGLYNAVKRVRDARDLQRAADGLGGTVGVIYGSEKPFVALVGQDVCVFYADGARVGIDHYFQHGGNGLYEPVMFYWGEPRITCKQAHVIKRELERDIRSFGDLDIYRRLIYPDWSPRYQRRIPTYGGVLAVCIGERAASIAAERAKNLSAIPKIKSRYYRVGTLHAVQRPG